MERANGKDKTAIRVGKKWLPISWTSHFGTIDAPNDKIYESSRTETNTAKHKKESGTIVLAHELFDALPIHQFEVSKRGQWCERMVDINIDPRNSTSSSVETSEVQTNESKAVETENPSSSLSTKKEQRQELRLVLSNGPTPAAKVGTTPSVFIHFCCLFYSFFMTLFTIAYRFY